MGEGYKLVTNSFKKLNCYVFVTHISQNVLQGLSIPSVRFRSNHSSSNSALIPFLQLLLNRSRLFRPLSVQWRICFGKRCSTIHSSATVCCRSDFGLKLLNILFVTLGLLEISSPPKVHFCCSQGLFPSYVYWTHLQASYYSVLYPPFVVF